MRITETFTVALPPADVYREVNDVGGIGSCIAGVKDIEIHTADESRWKIEVSAGFMAMNMNFDAKIVERREPEYVGFSAAGQNVSLDGYFAIVDIDEGSECTVVIDAEPKGPLAPLVEQMGRGVQQRLARKTIDNVRARLSPAGDDVAPSPAAALPEPRAAIPRAAIGAAAGLAVCLLVVLWAGVRRDRD